MTELNRIEVKVRVWETLVKALDVYCEYHRLNRDQVLTELLESALNSLITSSWNELVYHDLVDGTHP